MGTCTGFPPTPMLMDRFRRCCRLPHEVDNITEFFGIGFLDGGESFVSFKTDAALVVLGARHFTPEDAPRPVADAIAALLAR